MFGKATIWTGGAQATMDRGTSDSAGISDCEGQHHEYSHNPPGVEGARTAEAPVRAVSLASLPGAIPEHDAVLSWRDSEEVPRSSDGAMRSVRAIVLSNRCPPPQLWAGLLHIPEPSWSQGAVSWFSCTVIS